MGLNKAPGCNIDLCSKLQLHQIASHDDGSRILQATYWESGEVESLGTLFYRHQWVLIERNVPALEPLELLEFSLKAFLVSVSQALQAKTAAGLEEVINAPFGTQPELAQPSLCQARNDAHTFLGRQDCENAFEKGEVAI